MTPDMTSDMTPDMTADMTPDMTSDMTTDMTPDMTPPPPTPTHTHISQPHCSCQVLRDFMRGGKFDGRIVSMRDARGNIEPCAIYFSIFSADMPQASQITSIHWSDV
jgi:hypothetical protein